MMSSTPVTTALAPISRISATVVRPGCSAAAMPAPTLNAPSSSKTDQRWSNLRLCMAPKIQTAPASSANAVNSAARVISVMAGHTMAATPNSKAIDPRTANSHQERSKVSLMVHFPAP